MNGVRERVKEAGVVGAGGAGFPTHIKLSGRAEIVLVNGAECEPLLRTDQQLAAVEAELLVEGLAYEMEAVGAREGIIAFKAKYRAAIEAVKPLLRSNMRIEILRDIYPAGDEAITIWLVTGRRVPPGGIPLDIGVVVNNVQTVINIAKAMRGEPVTARTLTVTGYVREPGTVTVAIGTTLRQALELCGGSACEEAAYIEGGPVMGKLIEDLSKPVTKTTGGLIVLPKGHPLVEQKKARMESVLQIAKTVCEQCSYCTELCPRHIIGHNLQPHLIVRAVNYNHVGEPEMLTSALICSECGVCEAYACPVGISPRRINVALKAQLREKGIRYRGELQREDPMSKERLIPSYRLAARIGLRELYHQDAPLRGGVYEPEEVEIPLQQHIGVAAEPVVKVGEEVKKGMVIGEIPEGALGARVHASIDGVVSEITPKAITIKKGGGKA